MKNAATRRWLQRTNIRDTTNVVIPQEIAG